MPLLAMSAFVLGEARSLSRKQGQNKDEVNTVGPSSAEKARTVALSTGRDLVEDVERFVVAKARQEHQYRIPAQPMPRAGHRHLNTLLYNHTFACN